MVGWKVKIGKGRSRDEVNLAMCILGKLILCIVACYVLISLQNLIMETFVI
jgi:hypothetical protein